MLGGCYLCFEGAEKIWHWLHPHAESHAQEAEDMDAAHLEESRVAGAVKTDFILSAEIMTILLNAISADTWWEQGAILATAAVGITAVVYGTVAILVKMDDAGLKLSQIGNSEAVRRFGLGIVKFMPTLLKIISVIGTAAMLWVGGNIIVHGLEVLGWHLPYDTIKGIATSVSESIGVAKGAVKWIVTATLDGILGLILGLILIPFVTKLIVPVFSIFFPEKQKAAH
jgi:predicted DNA repair protein MutK